ncbi:hypothetical protein ACNKHM_10295 [Shigella sonnei]
MCIVGGRGRWEHVGAGKPLTSITPIPIIQGSRTGREVEGEWGRGRGGRRDSPWAVMSGDLSRFFTLHDSAWSSRVPRRHVGGLMGGGAQRGREVARTSANNGGLKGGRSGGFVPIGDAGYGGLHYFENSI